MTDTHMGTGNTHHQERDQKRREKPRENLEGERRERKRELQGRESETEKDKTGEEGVAQVVAGMVTADVESGHTEYAGGADYFGKGTQQ